VDETNKTEDDPQRIQEILAEMKALEGRDFQLWSISLLLLLVLAVGIGLAVLPAGRSILIDSRVLLILLYGLISLIVLYNIYVVAQRRSLRMARGDLVRQLMRAEAAEHMAMTDSLTGLFNRRYLEHAMATEAKRVSRNGQSLTILMFDLDNFGDVNKRLGHLEGDKILREFSTLLLEAFRQTDTVARLGGDEFVAVLSDATFDQAVAARDRLLTAVDRWSGAPGSSAAGISVSSGMAEYTGEEPVEETLERADEAMRQFKLGRASRA
jgi:diguanylate cyclase (GGDEF)-like protein